MPGEVSVIVGPARSGKTSRALVRYREMLRHGPPRSTLWLAPTWRAAAAVEQRLLDSALVACFSPGVMTFERMADTLLQFSPLPMRPLTRLMKRHLVRQIIDQRGVAGGLRHFRSIAQTSGLVDLVSGWIGELKRLEIWPEQYRSACEACGMSRRDEELLEIYEAYQQCLNEHQIYDAEGRMWLARTRLHEPLPHPLDGLRLVVADGFADFTRTQHEILEILAERSGELLLTVTLDSSPGREDLLTKPRKTLAELGRRHPRLRREDLPRPAAPAWPAMAHLEARLFTDPRQAIPAASTEGLEILAAARQLGEIELVGSRIKQMLTGSDPEQHGQAVRPGDVALVMRRPQDAELLLREVFGRLGIPFVLESGPCLARSPALAALVSLLRLDVDDWPLRGLLAVLGSNYFRPAGPEWQAETARAGVERTIREAEVPRGRQALLEQIARQLVAGVAAESVSSEENATALEIRQRQVHLRTTTAILEGLGATLDELPERATLAEWGQAWTQLAEKIGLRRGELPDELAWTTFHEALGSTETLARWMGRPAPLLDRREALAALCDMLANLRAREAIDEAGRVRILSAASVRTLEIPYLFFAGLSEKAFPAAGHDDRLYSEADYQRLISRGLPLIPRVERNREEMFLFYEVITRATRRLVLSYPALDESGQPLSPSPYLQEVELACGAGRILRTELADLSPIPAGNEPLTAAEFRVKALATALAGNVALLAGLVRQETAPGIAGNILAGLRLADQRRQRDAFGSAEGMLTSDSARAALAARFGPERTFSATELERYAACPYRFFLDQALRLEPLEELALAMDYLARGRRAHELLAIFHRRLNQQRGGPASPAEGADDDCQHLLRQTLDELYAQPAAGPMRAALEEIDRRLLTRWIADYRRQHAAYDALWEGFDGPPRPAHFEISFGREVRAESDPASTTQPLELGDKRQQVRLAGSIDRIDLGRVAGQQVFNIVDYKTGGSAPLTADAVARGYALQLPIYALAAEQLLLADRGATGWQAGYWQLKDHGFKARQALRLGARHAGGVGPDAAWEELRRAAVAAVLSLVRGMRGGQFPVFNEDLRCTGYCSFHTVCRIHQIRSLEKTWQPPHPAD